MPIYLCSLNSGSNANCYYVGNADGTISLPEGVDPGSARYFIAALYLGQLCRARPFSA